SLASGMMTDLFGSILTALIFCYVGLFIGISFDGYKFLKRTGRQKEFGRLSFQSFGGLLLGLFLFLMTTMLGSKLPHALINSLAIILPLLGTIIGFDYKIDQVEHDGNV
ncbi:MAG: hypothetical protein ACKO96_31400, partial [Flammeovirgaceae bacterium]